MGRRGLSNEVKERIIQMLAAGYTLKDVSEELQVSTSTVYKVRDEIIDCLPAEIGKPYKETKEWLEKNWKWKTPEKQPVRKRRSGKFRTPYNQRARGIV